MIPQADVTWFLSTILYTMLFFVIQFLLSKFLIFNLPIREKLHRDVMQELTKTRIYSLRDDIDTLKARRMDIESGRKQELDLIKFETVSQCQAEFDKQVKSVRKKTNDRRKSIFENLEQFQDNITKEKDRFQRVGKTFLEKIEDFWSKSHDD